MLVDWIFELTFSFKLLLAFFIGAVIGWDREKSGHEAGIRTFGLISLGSCAFGLISIYSTGTDIGRIAAQIIPGIGFICGGIIFREQGGHLKGITTAATLWCSAASGMAIAFDMYVVGLMNCLIILCFLSLKNTRLWRFIQPKKKATLLEPVEANENPEIKVKESV